jgi:hypothetical protein
MQCALCQQERALCDSHIIPSFVYAWLKETSATGYMRLGREINRRVQDGLKPKLLCEECEKRFSQFEKPFAANLFYPLHKDDALRLSPGPWFRYESWCMKFVASVSWRVLTFFSQLGLKNFTEEQQRATKVALSTWRSFLLGESENPRAHELHMILLDRMADHTFSNLPKNFNRYLVRSIEPDVVRGKESIFVYAKMCRVLIIGFIQKSPNEKWRGTKLHVRKGEIGGLNYELPSQLLKNMCDRAQRLIELETKLSPRQRQKIDDEFEKQKERALNSECLSISLYDYEMFGPPDVDSKE